MIAHTTLRFSNFEQVEQFFTLALTERLVGSLQHQELSICNVVIENSNEYSFDTGAKVLVGAGGDFWIARYGITALAEDDLFDSGVAYGNDDILPQEVATLLFNCISKNFVPVELLMQINHMRISPVLADKYSKGLTREIIDKTHRLVRFLA